jgi:DNA (cytosine-5)-methyltransferase 1
MLFQTMASGLRYNSLPLRWRFLRNTDVDNQQETSLRELHLFAGAGGGILGGQLLGHRCVCAVEWEPYAQACIVARQNDGLFPAFPVWDDVQTFDGTPWHGLVDIVAGGFPCQDISVAGKGAGIDGERSGMWAHMARIIGEVRPQYAFIENSPALVNRGLDRVLCDLAALGYDAEWTVMGASDVGAPHKRERIWILAHASFKHEQRLKPQLFNAKEWEKQGEGQTGSCCNGAREWPSEPGMGRVVDGMANRSNRLKAIGNGQVPRVAAAAFAYLKSRIAE